MVCDTPEIIKTDIPITLEPCLVAELSVIALRRSSLGTKFVIKETMEAS